MTTTYTTNRAIRANAAINLRKGFVVRTNSGKLISRHADKASADAAMRKYGITRCYVQFFLMRPIDYLYEVYAQCRAAGMPAQDAASYARCAARA